MSKESAAAFLERLEGDEVLAERLRGCTMPEAEAFVKEELGYDFTREEMQQAIFEKNPEITDEELEAVVGGMSDDMTYGIAIGVGIGGGMGLIALAIAAAGA
ncbi:MAG TPA: Nif11-like leader peptide family RiPP precursor [Synergistaceae bacterium]|nr:Nif11-like leader peptide family RiPP precursor [Synergistaceae bacterium]HPQ38076.1 Nif11-like leader peptide family RiPP precursor [Synergistaceae bacterium]